MVSKLLVQTLGLYGPIWMWIWVKFVVIDLFCDGLGKTKKLDWNPKICDKFEWNCLTTLSEMIWGIDMQSCRVKFKQEGWILCFNGHCRRDKVQWINSQDHIWSQDQWLRFILINLKNSNVFKVNKVFISMIFGPWPIFGELGSCLTDFGTLTSWSKTDYQGKWRSRDFTPFLWDFWV